MKLTDHQESFAQALAEGKNQTDAYIMAYETYKYKEQTIYSNASRLAKNPKIIARVEEIRKENRKNKLTLKEEAFVQALIAGESQRNAYKQAFGSKASDKTIDEKACRLFKQDKIAARYFDLREQVVGKAEEKAIMSATEVLEEISAIAKAKVSDFIKWNEEGEMVYRPSTETDTRAVKKVSYDSRGNLVIEFNDKLKALEKLHDMYQSQEEKSEDNDIKVVMGSGAAEYGE